MKVNQITIPKNWQQVRLGEVCVQMKSGGTPKSTNKDYYYGDIPFVKIEDMNVLTRMF